MFLGSWVPGRKERALVLPDSVGGSRRDAIITSSTNGVHGVRKSLREGRRALVSSVTMPQMNCRSKRERDENAYSESKRKPSLSCGVGMKKRRRRQTLKAPNFKHSFLIRNLGKEILTPSTTGDTKQLQYEIIELDNLAFSRFRMEWREDSVCPFCSFKETSTNRLIKHLHRFHCDHHSFQVEEQEDGVMKIQVRPSRAYREQSRAEMNRPIPKEPELKYEEFQFIRKRPVDKKRKRKRKRVDPWLPEGWAPNYADEFVDPWAVPAQYRDNLSKSIRRGQEEMPRLQYYHSRNRLPMRVGDWHVDSDDESDNEWIDQLGRGGLHEFLDVKDDEKLVLDSWSRFIRSDVFLSDKRFKEKVKAFLTMHASQLVNQRKQILMLLTMFSEHRLMPPSEIAECMKFYKTVVEGGSSGETKKSPKRFDGAPQTNAGKVNGKRVIKEHD